MDCSDARQETAARAELDAAESIVGDRPQTCPWWGFYDSDVREIRRVAAFGDFLSEGLGSDPEWWLLEGVVYYRRALEIASRQSVEQKPRVEEKPNGGVRIRG